MANLQEEIKKKEEELKKAQAEKDALAKQLEDSEAARTAEQEEIKKKEEELKKAQAEKDALAKQLEDSEAAKGAIGAAPAVIKSRKSRAWVRVRLRVPGSFDGYTRRVGEAVVIEGTKEDVNPNVFDFIEEIRDEKLVEELESQKSAEAKMAEARRRAKIR